MINRMVFSGRLGQDPEVRQVGDNNVTSFSLAQDQYNGKNKDKTTIWMNCECWGPIQALLKYVGKGDIITVDGVYREDKKGDKTYTKIKVDGLVLPGKNDSKSDGERVRQEAGVTDDDDDDDWG